MSTQGNDDKLIQVRIAGETYRLLIGPPGDHGGLFWADLWPGAVGLAEYVAVHETLDGVDTLELGCGLGLVGIVAAKRGARVLLTDISADALELATENARLNGVEQIETARLDWRQPQMGRRFQLVLGGDILYDRRNHPILLKAIDTLVAPDGRCVLSDPIRAIGTPFFTALRSAGLTYRQFLMDINWQNRQTRVGIYIIWRLRSHL